MRFELPPHGTLRPNNEHDPLPYYYKPVVGHLYRHRLQMGLDLLPRGARTCWEVGVGSGVLVPTLTHGFGDYTGTDLELAPGLERLVASGCTARFEQRDLLAKRDERPTYDVIVCFSVLEHIRELDAACDTFARSLAPRGRLVCGYPMVNRTMSRAFELIGFRGIDEHHVSAPAQIEAALGKRLRRVARRALPPRAPTELALYSCTAWELP